jgi:hypothetical protein
MTRNRNIAAAILASMALVGVAACADSAEAPFQTEQAAVLARNTEIPAGQRVAQLVALALREPSARGLFYRATSNSPIKEGKLFLGGFLGGEGTPLLQAMARAGGLKAADVQALVAQTGPVEIYLPVEAHRAAWTGGDNVIVAYAERDHAQPYGFALDGSRVELNVDEAPAVPTVVVTHAESFDAQGVAYGSHVANPSIPSGLLAPRLATLTVPFTGLWVDSIQTAGDFESWAAGSAEFEIYIQRADTRAIIQCVDAHNSVEPYKFDMNNDVYPHPVLLAQEGELPQGAPIVVAMYEDDDTSCVIKDDKDYVKLATDALTNAYSAYKGITSKEWYNGAWIMQLSAAYTAFKSFITGNDEFVGVSSGLDNIDSTDRHFFLKDETMANQGVMRLQWKTDTGY